MVTLKDVARQAGVSIRTVSNVVNDWPHIRPELRARVQTVIDDLGYQPNIAARNLRNGRSGLIALAVPELDVPYFAELTRCIVDEASARGLTVVVEQTDGLLERERELMTRTARAMMFDGIIFSPTVLTSAQIIAGSVKVPLVLLGENEGGYADHVLVDNRQAAYDATTHLIARGRRRVALVGPQTDGSRTSELRREGYEDALRDAGLNSDPALWAKTERFHRADGADAMRRLMLLDSPPDGVFCMSDLLALGALRHLVTSGIQVPDDVAVIGFDDIEDGHYSNPSLTSVSPDKRSIAKIAIDHLTARLAGTDAQPHVTTVSYTIVTRESTGPAHSAPPHGSTIPQRASEADL
jgi:DNA-binding LacI/PurR family transcriptional regulator